MLKSAARKILLEKRKNLSNSDCLKMDDLLLIQFQKMDWLIWHWLLPDHRQYRWDSRCYWYWEYTPILYQSYWASRLMQGF